MKEINFLPEWYKNGRRRQVSYRTQYIAIAGVFVVMVVWSVITTRSISSARAQVAHMAAEQVQAEKVSTELAGLKEQIRLLRKNTESIEEIDSRIDVASVLAEMSFLIDERIVLQRTEFIAEKFVDEQQTNKTTGSAAIVRAVKASSNNKKDMPFGNVRFKVVLAGVAADASDVAVLMCKLEESPYFCQVVLSYSRGDAEIETEIASSSHTKTDVAEGSMKSTNLVHEGKVRGKIQVNEFEINCYLANYRQL